MSFYSVEYLIQTEEQLENELTEIVLLGKSPVSFTCLKCSNIKEPCVLFSITKILGTVYRNVYCEKCARIAIIDLNGGYRGDPMDFGPN